MKNLRELFLSKFDKNQQKLVSQGLKSISQLSKRDIDVLFKTHNADVGETPPNFSTIMLDNSQSDKDAIYLYYAFSDESDTYCLLYDHQYMPIHFYEIMSIGYLAAGVMGIDFMTTAIVQVCSALNKFYEQHKIPIQLMPDRFVAYVDEELANSGS